MQEMYKEVANYAKHELNCILFELQGIGNEIVTCFCAQSFSTHTEVEESQFVSFNCDDY